MNNHHSHSRKRKIGCRKLTRTMKGFSVKMEPIDIDIKPKFKYGRRK
jgi:hypothetical protein